MNVSRLTSKQLGQRPSGEQWSGEATRNQGMLVEETRVDVTIGESDNASDASALRKERPVWMVESTIVTNDQVSIIISLISSRSYTLYLLSRSKIVCVLLQESKYLNAKFH